MEAWLAFAGRDYFFAMEAGRVFFAVKGGRVARMLHARAQLCVRMRGRSTLEHDSARKYMDAPHESAILRENASTLHTRARFCAKTYGRSTRSTPAKMLGRSTPERNCV